MTAGGNSTWILYLALLHDRLPSVVFDVSLTFNTNANFLQRKEEVVLQSKLFNTNKQNKSWGDTKDEINFRMSAVTNKETSAPTLQQPLIHFNTHADYEGKRHKNHPVITTICQSANFINHERRWGQNTNQRQIFLTALSSV